MTEECGGYHKETVWGRFIVDDHSTTPFNLILLKPQNIEAIFVGHGYHFMYDKLYNEIKVREVGSIAKPTPNCDHPKFIVEGRQIGYDGALAPFVEIERGCQ